MLPPLAMVGAWSFGLLCGIAVAWRRRPERSDLAPHVEPSTIVEVDRLSETGIRRVVARAKDASRYGPLALALVFALAASSCGADGTAAAHGVSHVARRVAETVEENGSDPSKWIAWAVRAAVGAAGYAAGRWHGKERRSGTDRRSGDERRAA